ncbi:MAG: HutD family protein [Candidatus Eremiobacteraeota bacterium]|nr:HutD family protein [Candidatus Eremiobacteraeota bacterium]
MRCIPQNSYRLRRWENGGGITYDIDVAATTPVAWRLSRAAIDVDGPFSLFPGMDRTILPLDGNGIVLSFHDAPDVRLDRVGAVFRFPGERQIRCTLIKGATRDLNVMTARDSHTHVVSFAQLDAEQRLPAESFLRYVYVLEGELCVPNCRNGAPERLEAGDTLRIDAGEAAILGGRKCRFCLIEIRARGEGAVYTENPPSK